MTLIQHQELTSNQNSITFSSIPQIYTDLYLLMSLRASGNAFSPLLRINSNNTAANYSTRVMFGNGSAVNNALFTANVGITLDQALNSNNYTANTFSNVEVYFTNYSLDTVSKGVSVNSVTENNATAAQQTISAGLWTPTAAITNLNLYGFTFVTGSSLTLYGILKGTSNGVTVT
jgi:hypothetical protein